MAHIGCRAIEDYHYNGAMFEFLLIGTRLIK